MEEKSTNLELILKNIDETRNYFSEEIKHNKLISVFASVFDIHVGITAFAAGLKNCVITVGIKMSKSTIKNKRKKYEKIVLLSKTKLNGIEVLISEALIYSYINRDKFISINKVSKKYDKIKEKIRNPNKK